MEALEQLETQVLALLEQKAQLLAETRRLHSELEATIAAKMSLEEENRELREQRRAGAGRCHQPHGCSAETYPGA